MSPVGRACSSDKIKCRSGKVSQITEKSIQKAFHRPHVPFRYYAVFANSVACWFEVKWYFVFDEKKFA